MRHQPPADLSPAECADWAQCAAEHADDLAEAARTEAAAETGRTPVRDPWDARHPF